MVVAKRLIYVTRWHCPACRRVQIERHKRGQAWRPSPDYDPIWRSDNRFDRMSSDEWEQGIRY
jgi:hypothetical protein